MALKIEKKCSRCRRTDSIEVASIKDAAAQEEKDAKRVTTAQEVEAFLKGIPADLLPDVVFYVKGQGVIHTDLCSPADDSKRSCSKRVAELLKQVEELDERKPRAKKAAA